MTNTYPHITRRREEKIPHLGWNWEMASQVESSSDNTILSRVFNVLEFTDAEVTRIIGKPPDYPEGDSTVTAYYRVSREMTQTKHFGQKTWTDKATPQAALNNFQGWVATPYKYAMDSYYLDLVYRRITWQPKLVNWTHPETSVVSQVPSNQYELVIRDRSNTLISSATQPVGTTALVLALDDSSWGVLRSAQSGTANGYLITSATSTSTTNLISTTKLLVTQSHLRLTKPAATYSANSGTTPPSITNSSSITLELYGEYWFGDVRFLNDIGEGVVSMHPEGTSEAIRLKPPGLSSLSDTWDVLNHFGTGTLVPEERQEDIVIV